MEYIIPLILTLVGIIFYPQLRTKGSRQLLVLVIFIYMVLLMGFRYRVGMDTIGYMRYFNQISEWSEFVNENWFKQTHEPGYSVLSSIIKTLTHEFWVLQLIMNLTTTTCVFIFLKRYSLNIFWSIFFFLLLQWLYFSTEVMRESVAIGIFLLNYRNLERKRWVAYYLISLLSIMFHYSAILIWFFPFVKFMRLNALYIILCVAILAITPLVEELNKLLQLGMISDKISTYVKDVDTVNMNWRISLMIQTGFPAIFVVLLYRYSRIKMKAEPLVLLQFLFCCGAFAIPVLFQRFTNYTTLFVTVALANYVADKEVKRRLRVFTVGLICISQSIYYTSLAPAWFPYVSIFEPHKNAKREELYRIIW